MRNLIRKKLNFILRFVCKKDNKLKFIDSVSSVEEMGFLSKEVKDAIRKYKKEHKEWFDLAEELNNCFHRIVFVKDWEVKDNKGILLLGLGIRALSTYQGIQILIERGMVSESRVLLRSLFEVMFILVSISKDDLIYDKYLKHSTYTTYRSMENILKAESFLAEIKTSDIDNKVLAEVKEKGWKQILKEKGLMKTQIIEYATIANALASYYTTYSWLSESVHFAARDIVDEHIQFSENFEEVSIKWGPDREKINETLFFTLEPMIVITKEINALLNSGESENIKKIEETYNILKKKLGVVGAVQ